MFNKIFTLFIILFLFSYHSISSQSNSDSFIKALLNNEDVKSYIDNNELQRSQRLGINYTDALNKFLISYDIDEAIKSLINIKPNGARYIVNEKKLDENYSLIEFIVPDINYRKYFYMKDEKFIAPSTYFSRNWSTKESKYFKFKISEPKYFNDYCIQKLDDFVDSMCTLLQIDESRKQQLEHEKIYYIMCKDDDEIELLTGYKARGIFITAFDEIISTYNTHFHELSHLMMNYKLQNLTLNTLPFFLEGFAVAMGGRGGIKNTVVMDIGYYLQKSGFTIYDSLISYYGFYNEDASLTYAVAGIYNWFLLNKLGTDKYLELYKSVNGSLEDVKTFSPDMINLPVEDDFEKFLNEYSESANILLEKPINDGYIKFSIDNQYFYPAYENMFPNDYISKKYNDIFTKNPTETCQYVYGIAADSVSVSTYNFLTNDIIASYSINFSLDRKQVPKINNKYEFYVKEDVFDGEVK